MWNVPRRFMCLNTGPPPMVLFGKAVEHLGGRALLEEVNHWDGPYGLMGQPWFLFVLLWVAVMLPPTPPIPACLHVTATRVTDIQRNLGLDGNVVEANLLDKMSCLQKRWHSRSHLEYPDSEKMQHGGELASVLQEDQASAAFHMTACNADSGLDENLWIVTAMFLKTMHGTLMRTSASEHLAEVSTGESISWH